MLSTLVHVAALVALPLREAPAIVLDAAAVTAPSKQGRSEGPCDIYDRSHTPCVAAHSVVRALYSNYTGRLYQVWREDGNVWDVRADPTSGFAMAIDQQRFCASSKRCEIVIIYDQSPKGNHLHVAPAGGMKECQHALKPVNATKHALSVGGHPVYGARFEGNQGYRNDQTSGIATGEDAETIYMVTRGDIFNDGCCFDYGNAETDNNDDGAGTMDALYFGSEKQWGHGQGVGPWVMADLENGLFPGHDKFAPSPSVNYTFVTAFGKGEKGRFALKAGNAQEGGLRTLYEGVRPDGYHVMRKQGAIILGIGGDNSCNAVGTFYEGVMTAGYTTDAADAAVQANIVHMGYGRSSA